MIDVVPIPGHDVVSIALYDRNTAILLAGDSVYPGRLYIQDLSAFEQSNRRMLRFTEGKLVAHILGNHIEMTTTPGRDFAMHIPAHPHEHVLQLPYSALLELKKSVDAMGDQPRLDIHADFILYPVP